jgi:ribose transport system permease protein
MTAGTARDGASTQTSAWARRSPADTLALICTTGLLIAFFALPWLSEDGTDVTGINLLVSGSPPLSPALSAALADLRWMLLLIPLAALMAGLGLTSRFSERPNWRWASRLVSLGGMAGVAYFVIYVIHDRDTPVFLMRYTGAGFWTACFASAILFLQRFLVQSSVGTYAVVGDRSGGRLRRSLGRLLDEPRVARAVASIFRFQSLFGLIIVILLAIVFSPTRGDANLFLGQRNLSNVTRDVAETGVLAVGQLLVIIIGGIDLSVGSVVALTATGVSYLLMRDLVPAIPAIMLILGLGLGIGWWNGWTSERFRIPSFITTLAMLSMARGLAHIWSNDIAVPLSYGAGGADPLFQGIGDRINGIFPVPAIIMFVVAIVMALVLRYTTFGRHLYAIGGNQTAARLSGLPVSRIKITAFMLCSFFAAMAGIMHAAQLNQGSPNEAVGYELNAIAAVVIGGASLSGGKGTIAGVIAGAFILGILDNMLSLNNVTSSAQLVIKGLLVVGAVALQQVRPRGAEA